MLQTYHKLLDRILVDSFESLPHQLERHHVVRCLFNRHVHHFHAHVDHHGNECQSDEQVDGGCQEELWMLRDDIAEADGAERYEDEVERVEERPFRLPGGIQEAADEHVDEGDQQGDHWRQVERSVDLVWNELGLFRVAVFRTSHVFRFLVDHVTPAPMRLVAQSFGRPSDGVSDALEHGHSQSAGGNHATDAPEAAGVVESTHKRPDVLGGLRERLAQVHEDDEAERDADQSVDDRNYTARGGQREDIAVSWNSL